MTGNKREHELFSDARKKFLSGELEEAQDILQEFLNINPGHPQALKNISSIQLKKDPSVSPGLREKITIIHNLYEQGYKNYRQREYDLSLDLFEKVERMVASTALLSHFADAVEELSA